MNLEDLKANQSILLEAISGSRAYGLQLPTSDTDIKGVFLLPKKQFYGFSSIDQVNDETNDVVFYELQRFMDLLSKNNPNLLELLSTPSDCILQRHAIMEKVTPQLFLSKLCEQTFAGYATTQIRKARGLNKKILNPMEKERKGILDFCYMAYENGSIPVNRWLAEHKLLQENCGLVNIPHMKNIYGTYHSIAIPFKGIASASHANDISISSIPKGTPQQGLMAFNREGYSTYCKEYKSYWEWVDKRNDARYENTISHGKNYDAKNMMHTFRLLDMAAEIASEGTVNVRRKNREELLSIRRGDEEYDDLVKRADEKIAHISDLYATCDLPESPNEKLIEELLIEMRETLYGNS
jgi:hypothetical protein